MSIIKLNSFPVPMRLRSGSSQLNFVLISPCFVIFKNAVHSLEPGEFLGVSSGSKLCATSLNIAKYSKTIRFGCSLVAFILFNLLLFSTVKPCSMTCPDITVLREQIKKHEIQCDKPGIIQSNIDIVICVGVHGRYSFSDKSVDTLLL